MQTVATDSTAVASPAAAKAPSVRPRNTQPAASATATRMVATAATPSRDSHDERHCENARHARSGRPRWAVDDKQTTAGEREPEPHGDEAEQPIGRNQPEGGAGGDERQQAEAGAGADREGDDGESGMHGARSSRQRDRMRSTQPSRPPTPSVAVSAGAGAAALRSRGGRYLLVGR